MTLKSGLENYPCCYPTSLENKSNILKQERHENVLQGNAEIVSVLGLGLELKLGIVHDIFSLWYYLKLKCNKMHRLCFITSITVCTIAFPYFTNM